MREPNMIKSTSPTDALSKIDDRAAIKLVTKLMAIPGRSGEERAIITAIRSHLKQIGIPASAVTEDSAHKRSPIGGEVGNLIVKLPGTIRGPRRLLAAHVDTVPLCVGCQPVRRGNRIVSRDRNTALGADDRAGASVLLHTLTEIQRRRLPHPPLTFFWPIQEEIGLYGARYVDRKKLGGPKLCFNWDGGPADAATIGATGGFDLRIDIEGVASHAGAHPEQGISAIGIAGVAIADLVREGWHGRIVKGSRTGTSNIGIIEGGDATNVVTSHLSLRAEARSHDPQFRQEIVDAFRGAFDKAVASVKNEAGATGKVRFDAQHKYESFRLSENDPAVEVALRAIAGVGLIPSLRTTNGGLDANWLTANGLPTVTLGCGQQDVHTTKESLEIDSYLHACRIGLLLATGI
jgi:tripeptide aminopeptidase